MLRLLSIVVLIAFLLADLTSGNYKVSKSDGKKNDCDNDDCDRHHEEKGFDDVNSKEDSSKEREEGNQWDESSTENKDPANIIQQLQALDFHKNPYKGPIDLVVSYLDATDEEWQRSFKEFGYSFDPDRYISSNEIYLNLITQSAFLPFIRKVFIVSPHKTNKLFKLDFLPPSFAQKVKFINQNEIIDPQYTPIFNTNAIESNFWKIPGLSEIFIYVNDDMMFAKPFDIKKILNGSAIVVPTTMRSKYCTSQALKSKYTSNAHTIQYINTLNVFVNHYGYCIPYVSSQHHPYVLSKTLLNITSQIFPQFYNRLNSNRIRNYAPFQKDAVGMGDVLFLYLSLYVGHHYKKIKFDGSGSNFRQILMNEHFKTDDITNRLADIFTSNRTNYDTITIQALYKLSNKQFTKVCSHILHAACQVSSPHEHCEDLEYFKQFSKICSGRRSVKSDIKNTTNFLQLSNVNYNSLKTLHIKSKIPSTNYDEILAKSNFSIVTELDHEKALKIRNDLDEIFTSYDYGYYESNSSMQLNFNSSENPQVGLEKLHVTLFNPERGVNWREQCKLLMKDPLIKSSDVLLLNEFDQGMARSNNENTVHSFAKCLSMNYVFALEFVELGFGTSDEQEKVAKMPLQKQKNLKGYHGNAIMSKFPLTNVEMVHLQDDMSTDHWFKGGHHDERRIGGRVAVIATLPLEVLRSYPLETKSAINGNTKGNRVEGIDLVIAHLENRRTLGEEWNLQAAKILAGALNRRNATGGVILGGDFGNPRYTESAFANYFSSAEGFFDVWATNTNQRAKPPLPLGDWILAKGNSNLQTISNSIHVVSSEQLSDHNFVTVQFKLVGLK